MVGGRGGAKPRPLRAGPGGRGRGRAAAAAAAAGGGGSTERGAGRVQVRRVLFAAGGTGGHVFPALAIAEALEAAAGGAGSLEIAFAGSAGRMEARAVPGAGRRFLAVPGVALARPLWHPRNLLLPARLAAALIACWRLLGRERPCCVVGTGGYVSLPTGLAAVLRGVPLFIQEQNAQAGVANRVLGLFARRVFLAFAGAAAAFPARARAAVMGNPVRRSLLGARADGGRLSRAAAAAHFGLPPPGPTGRAAGSGPEGKVVAVLGGSLGAQRLNEVLQASAGRLRGCGVHVVWQTGPAYFERFQSAGPGLGARGGGSGGQAVVLPFVEDMAALYTAADLVVARAGAVTCSELLATQTPAILVPSPNVAGDHQTRNAEALETQGAAVLLAEQDLTPDVLVDQILGLLGDEAELERMVAAGGGEERGGGSAADAIARSILTELLRQ